MKLLTMDEMETISNKWLAVTSLPIEAQDAFYKSHMQATCRLYMPLGELLNPKIKGYAWVWGMKNCIVTEPITEKHRFNANGLEGCFSVDTQLSTAILIYREVEPDRINIFVPKEFCWRG